MCPVCRELFLFEPRSLLFCTKRLWMCVNLPRTCLLTNLAIENINFSVRELNWAFGISERTHVCCWICFRHYVLGWQAPFQCCRIELAVLNPVFTIAAWWFPQLPSFTFWCHCKEMQDADSLHCIQFRDSHVCELGGRLTDETVKFGHIDISIVCRSPEKDRGGDGSAFRGLITCLSYQL